LSKKKRISERVDEINILVEYYKNMEAQLKKILDVVKMISSKIDLIV